MASSSSSTRLYRYLPPTTPDDPDELTDELTELSEVPCYTCRRRHVKCDRILPTCAKCAKKGVPCLGYQKPLRWADGVAVRGKLKGKSEPVVDNNVVNIVRNTIQVSSNSVMTEAAHFGLHATKSASTDVGSNDAIVLELMAYHNSCMRMEKVMISETRFIRREIAPLSLEVMPKLPRDIVNCVLSIAAVHRACRSPSSLSLERLALEAKVNVFQSFNRLLQNPHNSQADLIVIGGLLVFSMDLFEYGLSRWVLHFLGSLHVMSTFGGIENLLTYYPHLELAMTHAAHSETFWPVLSHVAITKPKQASRRSVELLCHASLAKRSFFTPSPAPLRVLVWDIGSCASRMLLDRDQASLLDVHKREQILHAILAFRPRDGSLDLMDYLVDNVGSCSVGYSNDRINLLHHFDLSNSIFKDSITILCLRYLYLGRQSLIPPHHRDSQSSSGSLSTTWLASNEQLGPYDQIPEDFQSRGLRNELPEPKNPTDYLSADYFPEDSLSRSPSPMPSPLLPLDSLPDLWERRYDIYNGAFLSLRSSLIELRESLDPECTRYILIPLIIFALVTRTGSAERELCLAYFATYKECMTKRYPRGPVDASMEDIASGKASPQGGEELTIQIPWGKLDAFSARAESVRRDSVTQYRFDGIIEGAPEWNWFDMLSDLEMTMIWPITSGTSHYERGGDFWAFELLSSVVNDATFSKWTGSGSSE